MAPGSFLTSASLSLRGATAAPGLAWQAADLLPQHLKDISGAKNTAQWEVTQVEAGQYQTWVAAPLVTGRFSLLFGPTMAIRGETQFLLTPSSLPVVPAAQHAFNRLYS